MLYLHRPGVQVRECYHVLLVVLALLLTACGPPELAAVRPLRTPTPSVSSTIIPTSSAIISEATTVVSLRGHFPVPTLPPTAGVQAITMTVPPLLPPSPPVHTTMAAHPSAPPPISRQAMAAVFPLSAESALLYTSPERVLMLSRINGKDPVWLTAAPGLCGRSTTALSQRGLWSADGRYLAISCQEDGTSRLSTELPTVGILDTTSGQFQRLNLNTNPALRVETDPLSWSPTAPTLLVTTNESKLAGTTVPSHRWLTVDARTGTMHRLASLDEQPWGAVAWSPTGHAIAVITGPEDGHTAVSIIDLTRPSVHRLTSLEHVTHFSGFNGTPTWSPDGTTLFVDRELNPSPDMYSFELLQVELMTERVQVVATASRPLAVHYSPDGQWYVVGDPLPVTLRSSWTLYHADGHPVRTFSADLARSISCITWTDDSRHLIMAADRTQFGVEVIRADLEGEEHVLAVYPNATATDLAVSPDETWIAIGLSGFHVEILDSQGHKHESFDGQINSWRPTQAAVHSPR